MNNKMKSSEIIKNIAATAGISVNGKNPWDVQVHNDNFYLRVLKNGSLGLGESYMDGWWDCAELDQFFYRVMLSDLERAVGKDWRLIAQGIFTTLFNRQSRSRAFKVGEAHYDIGNDVFSAMLDKRMTYTCGYWKGASNLDEAQENKLELVCQKLGLTPGMKVLDIGCGWGSFAKYAAEKYGVNVVGITVSKEQVELGKKLCEGLAVDIRLQDYREISEKFDRIVSLGMFEHVGYKNYRAFMEIARKCLEEDGLFLLHTIGSDVSRITVDPWTDKYIFPNGMLPSIRQISSSIESLFVMEDWHNFGADYDKTLMAWFENFNSHWDELKLKYPERFYRMWKYYLLSSAGMFRARKGQLWQMVLSPKGVPGGYRSVR